MKRCNESAASDSRLVASRVSRRIRRRSPDFPPAARQPLPGNSIVACASQLWLLNSPAPSIADETLMPTFGGRRVSYCNPIGPATTGAGRPPAPNWHLLANGVPYAVEARLAGRRCVCLASGVRGTMSPRLIRSQRGDLEEAHRHEAGCITVASLFRWAHRVCSARQPLTADRPAFACAMNSPSARRGEGSMSKVEEVRLIWVFPLTLDRARRRSCCFLSAAFGPS